MNDPILENLNPQQLEAVTAPDGPLLIIAGAGSGKTRVITRRIAYLVCRRGVRPYEIFAATFTNKAADEMKRRVAELIGGASPRDFHIATFHSLCARILRREASALDLSRSFTICDERDQLSAIKHVMKQMGISEKQLKPADVQHVINQCKMRMLVPEEAGQIVSSQLEDMYVDVFTEYEKYLRSNSAVDFEDLILRVVRLFQTREDVLLNYQRRYRHVMVDEYQDTNAVQFELVKLLAREHQNLAVVGDEDQSIYSWRGADISNLLNFQEYFQNSRLVRLEQNYRSTGNILKAAAGVISKNSQRLGKNLFTELGEGAPVQLLISRHELEESAAVADTIESLIESGRADYKDIAIFYRMGALSRIFEDRLRQRNIPYRVVGGVRFYDRAEIKDLIAYLQVIENPSNSIALLRIINTPKRGIGQKSLQAIIDWARGKRVTEFDALSHPEVQALLPKSAARQAGDFVTLVRHWQELAAELRPSAILKQVLLDTDYIRQIGDPQSVEVRARTENIEELESAMVLFEREYPGATLNEYLENVSLVSSTEEGDDRSTVSLMTLHAAKGLEFKAVFIVGMDESVFPSLRSIMEYRDSEEERRLFYVGITRARELLVLSHSDSRVLYGEVRYLAPSSLLSEIPKETLVLLNGSGGPELGLGREAHIQRSISAIEPSQPRMNPVAELPRNTFNAKLFDLGRKVRHPMLGEAIITGMSGEGKNLSLLILLPDGTTHRLLARYSVLELVEE
jgi:DNA helicase-2/ATP-dependent DNA helicase PcrA